jgi:uncharacterized protein (DUF2147 family)
MTAASIAARICLIALTLTLWGATRSACAAEETLTAAIAGRWLTEPRDGIIGIIEITRTADGLHEGRIIGGNSPHRTDANNPDPERRHLLLLGQIILRDLHEDGPGRLSGGTIYDPDNGRTYKCRIELLDRDHLEIRGFIGISLLGRSQTWTRFTGPSLDLSAGAR